ncbi:hypothetical protein [uncultured Nitratireductor sp.]|uniref:hypothetical protein n=1 Tax=uncultured Nitratireductor sp. TaxID=520953 RepID=UPI003455A6AC
MHGRLDLKHRVGLDGVEMLQMRARGRVGLLVGGLLASKAPVAQGAVDAFIVGQAPEAEVVPEERGRMGMQIGIGRVGILNEVRIVRIELNGFAIMIVEEVGWSLGHDGAVRLDGRLKGAPMGTLRRAQGAVWACQNRRIGRRRSSR